MSIIIKANELNLTIYKYLLEAGLEHSAYTLFHQADISSSANQFKFDIKSGHLLSLLEKALIFAQIESHMNFNQYQQCNQPFHLIQKHRCTITQKIITNKQNHLQELNNMICDSIRRTNSIYNSEIPNRQYQEIIYQPRGINYIEKWPKFKIIKSTEKDNLDKISSKDLQRDNLDRFNQIIIKGNDEGQIAIYDPDQKCITLLKINLLIDIQIQSIIPTIIQSDLTPILNLQLQSNIFIEIFQQNLINIRYLNSQKQEQQFYSINLDNINMTITECNFNQNFPFLVNFYDKQQTRYCILNLKNLKIIQQGEGILIWRAYNQYLVWNSAGLLIKALGRQNQTKQLKIDEIYTQFRSIKINSSKTLIAILTNNSNIYIYTLDQSQPLYILKEQQSNTNIIAIQWVQSKEVQYLAILGSKQLRIWQVELNSYCKIIQLHQYDSTIWKIEILNKNQTEKYLIALGNNHLMVYDITMIKIQRVELNANNFKMNKINNQILSLWNQNNLYFVSKQQLEPLFI